MNNHHEAHEPSNGPPKQVMEFAPKTYSQAQMDELDRLTEKWVNDHYSQRQTALE